MKPTVFFLLLSTACWSLKAIDTNTIYVTDTGFLSVNYQEKIKEAKATKESLSAEDFPEGNWGMATNGFQISLRFEKQVFTNGEPIFAIILLRNTTNRVLSYTACFSSVSGQQRPIGLRVFSENGDVVSQANLDDIDVVSAKGRSLIPRTQHKYIERLDGVYNLQTNGTYYVEAAISVFSPKRITVTSAKVPIKIENPPLASGSK